MAITLHPHQEKAIKELQCGKILVGDTGSGKSITALKYYEGIDPAKLIVIITTAKKRDKGEWYEDAMKVSLRNDIEVDSWNNIQKYTDRRDVFFIFDEQRVVGYGAWTQAFLKITSFNHWILLSATPADVWMDLLPVFIANGFFRNKSEFVELHVQYARFAKYPKVERYWDEHILDKLAKQIYVEMPDVRHTKRHEIEHLMAIDRQTETLIHKRRWHSFEDRPLKDVGEMLRVLRQLTNTDPTRYQKVLDICRENPRVIIFYNHNYELDILRNLREDLNRPLAEWNGHNHQEIPNDDEWVYLVQYNAGNEGWNCITTDTMIFYSLPYSYRVFTQAKGRIDRLNTPYTDLYYHILKSESMFDRHIWRSLQRKKNFQAARFAKLVWPDDPPPSIFN